MTALQSPNHGSQHTSCSRLVASSMAGDISRGCCVPLELGLSLQNSSQRVISSVASCQDFCRFRSPENMIMSTTVCQRLTQHGREARSLGSSSCEKRLAHQGLTQRHAGNILPLPYQERGEASLDAE